MQEQLFIPTKIKAGYQKREDTYSKKLAYITYFDEKNVLRKEKSWEGWRDKKINPDEFENKAIEGFVLNRDGGGGRGWDARTAFIRVWDPRGFEIEIGIENLLFILQENSSIKGKGLEGEFVYAWSGPTLILLPANSNEYKNSMKYTSLQSMKVVGKELIVGATYQTKRQKNLIYLGRFPVYGSVGYIYGNRMNAGLEYVFGKYEEGHKNKQKRVLESYPSSSLLSNLINETPVSDFAEWMDVVQANEMIGKIKSYQTHPHNVRLKKGDNRYSWNNDWDVSELNGEHYRYNRSEFKSLEKFEDTLFIEIAPSTYQVYNLVRERKVINPKRGEYDDLKWEHSHYGLTSSRIVTIINDEILEKSAKNPYKDSKFSKKDLLNLSFVKITISSKKGKTYKLFND